MPLRLRSLKNVLIELRKITFQVTIKSIVINILVSEAHPPYKSSLFTLFCVILSSHQFIRSIHFILTLY